VIPTREQLAFASFWGVAEGSGENKFAQLSSSCIRTLADKQELAASEERFPQSQEQPRRMIHVGTHESGGVRTGRLPIWLEF